MKKESNTPSQDAISLMLNQAYQLKNELPEFKSKFDVIINLLNDVNYMAFIKIK